jgi:LacI family transcriptional regulator
MATSEDVARLAGVSRATVSRLLNGTARLSASTEERVRAAVAALGYEPDVAARNLVGQLSHQLALSLFGSTTQVGQPGAYFYLQVVRDIERRASAAGYDLLLPSPPRSAGLSGYIRSLRARRVAGVIMGACPAGDPRIHALVEAEIPTVFIDVSGTGRYATYVTSDNVCGSQMATEHLIKLGHRRIAVVAGHAADLAGIDRLSGTRAALGRAHLAEDPTLIRYVDWTTEGAYRATKDLLDHSAGFTAVIAHNDLMAIGALRALREYGLKVPEQVSVTGFDDIDLSSYTNPPLTTVRQDHEAMATRTVGLLLDMIEFRRLSLEPVVLPTTLEIRGSTGPVRAKSAASS